MYGRLNIKQNQVCFNVNESKIKYFNEIGELKTFLLVQSFFLTKDPE